MQLRRIRERVSNVVVIGTGEPLDNYDNLLRFISLLTDENGLHISQRNVTVSTCGLVPEIYKLAQEKLQITLAPFMPQRMKSEGSSCQLPISILSQN